jgi:UPF0288 family protein (methanogenesis marker protein 3)
MQTEQQHGKPDEHGRGPKPVTVSVNEQQVEMPKGEATGADLKQAAIAQGVAIQEDFALFKREKGDLDPVQDNETVKLKKGDEFTAVAPDDYS